MRTAPLMAGLLILAGCASQPETATVPAGASTAKAPVAAATPVAGTVYAATETPEATTIAEAQKLGYQVVNEDGELLYCRETPKLGSHVKKDRTCLTEQEMLAAREANQRNFENMKKSLPPPAGK